MIFIVMGVSGSGKTLIGSKLAKKLSLPFYDGDDFHSDENIKKMSSGIPLEDNDRKSWLYDLSQAIIDWEHKGGAVLACSALKQQYRDILVRSGIPHIYIYLKGDKNLISQRIKRRNHFMPLELLDSQFKTLEEPHNAIIINIDASPEEIIASIIKQLNMNC